MSIEQVFIYLQLKFRSGKKFICGTDRSRNPQGALERDTRESEVLRADWLIVPAGRALPGIVRNHSRPNQAAKSKYIADQLLIVHHM